MKHHAGKTEILGLPIAFGRSFLPFVLEFSNLILALIVIFVLVIYSSSDDDDDNNDNISISHGSRAFSYLNVYIYGYT